MKKLFYTLLCLFSLATASFAQKNILVDFALQCEGKYISSKSPQTEFNYTNAFGTKYQINDVQFFISNIEIRVNGEWISNATQIKKDKEYTQSPFYMDDKYLLNRLHFSFSIKAKQPVVDSIRFTFGIPKELNKSYSLEDPEMARMYWPEALGGGYHYMKLNIKFIDKQDSVSLFNCHLGRGVVGDTFIDNDFSLTLPVAPTTDYNELSPKQWHKKTSIYGLSVTMNIEKWFTEPNLIDFNLYTKGIMGNQEVMGEIIENGKNTFSVCPLYSHDLIMKQLKGMP